MNSSKKCQKCKNVFFKKPSHSYEKFRKEKHFCSFICYQAYRVTHKKKYAHTFAQLGNSLKLGKTGQLSWNKKYENGPPQEVVRGWRNKASRKYASDPANRIKRKARSFLNDRIRDGSVIRLPCESCKNPKSEAHHHKGYAQEHWLHVQWLCKKCHCKLHKDLTH